MRDRFGDLPVVESTRDEFNEVSTQSATGMHHYGQDPLLEQVRAEAVVVCNADVLRVIKVDSVGVI